MRGMGKAIDRILDVVIHAVLIILTLFALYVVASCFLCEIGVGDGPRVSFPRCGVATRLLTRGLL